RRDRSPDRTPRRLRGHVAASSGSYGRLVGVVERLETTAASAQAVPPDGSAGRAPHRARTSRAPHRARTSRVPRRSGTREVPDTSVRRRGDASVPADHAVWTAIAGGRA